MAFTAFAISQATGGGVNTQFSATVPVAASEKIRVRFTKFTGTADAYLEIVNNGVTTFVSITSKQAWVSPGVAVGDVCRLKVDLNSISLSAVEGVLETIT